MTFVNPTNLENLGEIKKCIDVSTVNKTLTLKLNDKCKAGFNVNICGLSINVGMIQSGFFNFMYR
jgi:hypothetical protein